MGQENIKLPKCLICNDTGFVLYHKEYGNTVAEYIAHCICAAGREYQYDGTKCENKSNYRVPVISEVMDPAEIALENLHEWWERNKSKKGIEEFLEEKKILIPERWRQ